MKCIFCKVGNTKPGFVTVTMQRGNSTIIFKGVPAEVCENCGEYFLSEEITEKLLDRAEEAVTKGAEVEIIKYAA